MLKKLFISSALLSIAIIVSAVFGFNWYMENTKNDVTFFESDIRAFEALDKKSFPEPNNIVFVGSSSIRLWESLAEDMAPLSVIQRGFGGAHMLHVLHNFERIVTPYQVKAIVVFVGGNDIGSGKSSEQLINDYQKFISKVEQQVPQADLWILAMKPSKLRWKQWPEMVKVDEALRDIAETSASITFVETGEVLLNEEGFPDDVYIFDGLHLNKEGYRRWTEVLHPLLLEKYNP